MADETFTPDIPKAVRELVDMIEAEESKQSSRQNSEVKAACRNALKALIGSRHLNKAKEYLARHEKGE